MSSSLQAAGYRPSVAGWGGGNTACRISLSFSVRCNSYTWLYFNVHIATRRVDTVDHYHPRSEGDIVLSSVRLCLCRFVCLHVWMSVNTITHEPLEISSRNFQGMVKRKAMSENGCIGVCGWWFNVWHSMCKVGPPGEWQWKNWRIR